MRLSEAELAEGRRLLEIFNKPLVNTLHYGLLTEFLLRHADALLSAAADAETIRQAGTNLEVKSSGLRMVAGRLANASKMVRF